MEGVPITQTGLLTRAEFRRRNDRVNSTVLICYLAGFIGGCLFPIAGLVARHLMGPAFPESVVLPTLGATVLLWVAGPVGGVIAGSVLRRRFALRCPRCGESLVDDANWSRILSPGICPRCGAPVFADAAPMAPAFSSRDDFLAKHADFRRDRLRFRLNSALGFGLAAAGLGGVVILYPPLAAHATLAIPFGILILMGGFWLFARYRWGSDPRGPDLRCRGCGKELANLAFRLQNPMIVRVLRTGACPYCAAPLFPVDAPATR